MLFPPEARVLEAATRQAAVLTGDPNHTVAAAAMDVTGEIFTAVNDYHFTGGPCAELVLLGVAAAAAAKPLTTIVAVGDQDRGVIAPCGRCRQVLLDQQPGCVVIVPTTDGPDLVSVRDLLPYAFEYPGADPERLVRFSARYYDDVVAGRKTATTRFNDPIRPGPAWLVFEFDERYRYLHGVVDSIEPKRFADLTDQDAQLEGGTSAEGLRDGLRQHYPDINPDSPVELVRFHLEIASAQSPSRPPGRTTEAGTKAPAQLAGRETEDVYPWCVTERDFPIPQIGRFLVELERLEREQADGVFLVDRLEATPAGVKLVTPSGAEVVLPVDASTVAIGEALREFIAELQLPDTGEDPGFSARPDVQTQWAQLHYALGAYENAILADAEVQVLGAERHEASATVHVLRGPHRTLETYSIDLDREIDTGLADTLAFAPAYGLVNGSLNPR